jgi:hypothetical protein
MEESSTKSSTKHTQSRSHTHHECKCLRTFSHVYSNRSHVDKVVAGQGVLDDHLCQNMKDFAVSQFEKKKGNYVGSEALPT